VHGCTPWPRVTPSGYEARRGGPLWEGHSDRSQSDLSLRYRRQYQMSSFLKLVCTCRRAHEGSKGLAHEGEAARRGTSTGLVDHGLWEPLAPDTLSCILPSPSSSARRLRGIPAQLCQAGPPARADWTGSRRMREKVPGGGPCGMNAAARLKRRPHNEVADVRILGKGHGCLAQLAALSRRQSGRVRVCACVRRRIVCVCVRAAAVCVRACACVPLHCARSACARVSPQCGCVRARDTRGPLRFLRPGRLSLSFASTWGHRWTLQRSQCCRLHAMLDNSPGNRLHFKKLPTTLGAGTLPPELPWDWGFPRLPRLPRPSRKFVRGGSWEGVPGPGDSQESQDSQDPPGSLSGEHGSWEGGS
jgi:hypothetical protein